MTGSTQSQDFPTTSGVYSESFAGGALDAFVSILSKDMTSLLYSTLLGGSKEEYTQAVLSDFEGNIYIAGYTSSTNYPVTTNSYNESFNGGTYDGFITKLNNTLTSIENSTYIGGSS
jgi:hypothetical protein